MDLFRRWLYRWKRNLLKSYSIKEQSMTAKAKQKKQWTKWKKKAPKVPDITCPQIDYVLGKVDAIADKQKLSEFQHDLIMKKMEKLRTANELLRESGQYWYEIAKEHLSKK
tara:strand:- start:773 stop:1105 length:333 start_codon:yes stop_codon:yes gene_type:complete